MFFALSIAAVLIFAAFTGSSYLLGKAQGEYSERFKLAEQHDFFLNVDSTKAFNGHKLTLSKVLLDSSLTSIVLESDLNLDYFDSIILKDNHEHFYRKAFTLFEKQYYKDSNNIYTLDFAPARPEADTLILELTKFHKDESFTNVTFEVVLENMDKFLQTQEYMQKYFNLMQTEVSGIGITLNSLERGISHTGLKVDLDFDGTIYDGISFGWYPGDGLRHLNVLDLKAKDGELLKILSVEDVTIEQLIPASDKTTILRQSNRTYRIITTPLSETSKQLEMKLLNLFTFKYIHHNNLQLDFTDGNRINFDKSFASDHYTIKLNYGVRENNKIKLFYEIQDNNNQPLPDHLLDARIRITDNRYDVPVQGLNRVEANKNYVEFENMDTNKYTLDLFRVGFELKSGTHIIELR